MYFTGAILHGGQSVPLTQWCLALPRSARTMSMESRSVSVEGSIPFIVFISVPCLSCLSCLSCLPCLSCLLSSSFYFFLRLPLPKTVSLSTTTLLNPTHLLFSHFLVCYFLGFLHRVFHWVSAFQIRADRWVADLVANHQWATICFVTRTLRNFSTK